MVREAQQGIGLFERLLGEYIETGSAQMAIRKCLRKRNLVDKLSTGGVDED